MDQLIQNVADNLGIDAEQAERAVGVLLSLVKSNGDQAMVTALFARLPGAAELAARYDSGTGSRGLFGMLGGPMAALAKLKATGLDTEQMGVLGQTVLGYAKHHAGEDLVRDVAGSIPGLGKYV